MRRPPWLLLAACSLPGCLAGPEGDGKAAEKVEDTGEESGDSGTVGTPLGTVLLINDSGEAIGGVYREVESSGTAMSVGIPAGDSWEKEMRAGDGALWVVSEGDERCWGTDLLLPVGGYVEVTVGRIETLLTAAGCQY